MAITGRTSLDDTGLSARAEGRQVAEIVAERIERLIMDGVLKVGDPLPSERRLCEKLGASRSAVREGLRILRSLGLIETRHGKASFVARLTADRDSSPLMHLFNSQPRTLYDLLEKNNIAVRLHLAQGTVRNYLSNAMQKTQTRTRHDAARYAREHDWL